jgi:hypothetical protein
MNEDSELFSAWEVLDDLDASPRCGRAVDIVQSAERDALSADRRVQLRNSLAGSAGTSRGIPEAWSHPPTRREG